MLCPPFQNSYLAELKKKTIFSCNLLLLAKEREVWELTLGVAGSLVRVEVKEAEASVGILGGVVHHAVYDPLHKLAELLDQLVLVHPLGDVANIDPAVLQLDINLQLVVGSNLVVLQ